MISYFWCYLHKTLTLKIQILNVFDSPSAFQGGNISTNMSSHSPFLICFDGQLETFLIRGESQSKPLHFQWTFKSIFHTVTIGSAVTDEKCVWNRFTASSGANDRRCVCVFIFAVYVCLSLILYANMCTLTNDLYCILQSHPKRKWVLCVWHWWMKETVAIDHVWLCVTWVWGVASEMILNRELLCNIICLTFPTLHLYFSVCQLF